jgi:hypothetical protein
MTLQPGTYRHSKSGNLYRVIGTAKHSETLEEFVVYEALYENSESKLWIRPLAMFTEVVEIDGEQVPRFALVEPE